MASHDHSDGDNKGKGKANPKLLQDPLALAGLLNEVHARDAIPFLYTLPPAIRRRVNALRKLQLDAIHKESEFYRRVHELECEYAEKHQPLTEKRKQIVNGMYEPNDDECKVPIPEEEEVETEALADDLKSKANIQNGPDGKDSSVTGIPEFWLTTFKNVEIIAEAIQEQDEEILKHLTEVEVKTSKDPMMFTLYFHFSPNEYFTNATLTKEYTLKCEPNPKEPFDFEGPEIVSCKGCKIDWKQGKNVTVKLIKKKQKHKQKGATRFVTKEVKADSFFNFFDPVTFTPGEEDELDDVTRDLLNADFEMGQILRDRILPRAVLYFTGEAADDDDFDEDEDEEEDEDLDDEEESDEDPKV
jgi:nucleosome assembly protein 1-like 1